MKQEKEVVLKKRRRSKVHPGQTIRAESGCGDLYVTINWDKVGPIEVFASLGKAGGCSVAHLEALTRAITLGIKYNIPLKEYTKHLKGIKCPTPTHSEGAEVPSCLHAIGRVLEDYGNEKPPDYETFYKTKETKV